MILLTIHWYGSFLKAYMKVLWRFVDCQFLPKKVTANLKNHKIQKNKENGPLWGSNPQSLDCEANALPLDQLDMLYLISYM